MKKALMNQMTISIFEVMETMFYLMLEEKPADEVDLGTLLTNEPVKACRIEFSGDVSGSIFLVIPLRLLKEMARNFMGQSQDAASDEILEGTLKESLNMIAGNALTKLNKTSYMGLGIPELAAPEKLTPDREWLFFDSQAGVMSAFAQMN